MSVLMLEKYNAIRQRLQDEGWHYMRQDVVEGISYSGGGYLVIEYRNYFHQDENDVFTHAILVRKCLVDGLGNWIKDLDAFLTIEEKTSEHKS